MRRLGIGDGARVVIYDARENMWAARLWWMLRAFGFDDAAVLDGGSTPRPRAGLFVGKEEVLAAIEDPDTCIVCALGRRQYRGECREYGRRRGHIPGARNVSAWQILDRGTQRYRPVEELRELFGPILDARRVITYCGSGIAASSVALALHLVGHPDVAVYDGGFMEWSRDPGSRSRSATAANRIVWAGKWAEPYVAQTIRPSWQNRCRFADEGIGPAGHEPCGPRIREHLRRTGA